MSKKGNGSSKGNDQRSDTKNPNNPAEKAARDNRSVQKNSDSKQVKK